MRSVQRLGSGVIRTPIGRSQSQHSRALAHWPRRNGRRFAHRAIVLAWKDPWIKHADRSRKAVLIIVAPW